MARAKKRKLPFTKEDAFSLAFALAISMGALYLSTKMRGLSMLGYAGAFFISLVASASIFIPVPGFLVVIALARSLNPVLLGIAAGAGSGIGELSGYLFGYAGHDAVAESSLLRSHRKQVEKYGMPAIFVLAFLPSPLFDFAGIAAGAIKMEWWKFLLATIAGKIVRFILLAYLSLWASGLL